MFAMVFGAAGRYAEAATPKSVAQLAPVHSAQLITYLKLAGCSVGLLINFNVPLLKQGIRRIVLPEQPGSPKADG